MSVSTEIQRVKTAIENAYDAAELKGAQMPAVESSTNLASTIATIQNGADLSKVYTIDMAEEALRNVIEGESGDYYTGGQEALDILNNGAILTPIGDNWTYVIKDVEVRYQDILTSDYNFVMETLTNVIGESN